MIERLEALDGLGAEIAARAARAGVLAVWRTQLRSVRRVVVRAGRTEESTSAVFSGHGVQVRTAEGRMALASRDGLDPLPALRLLDRAADAARSGESLGVASSADADLPVVVARSVPSGLEAFEETEAPAVAARLAEIEREVAAAAPGVRLRLTWVSDLDAWRVLRSDGTDVLYAMPRAVLRAAATTGGDGSRHSIGASVAGPDPRLAWNERLAGLFLRRAVAAARLARELPGAPVHPAGCPPLVIDYTLAKGLAHEAFGHAAEADGFRSSVLARDGRYRTGERVGADRVSIVDEPIPGDHAWQPYGPNGLVRERAAIVDRGALADALADPWSAAASGVAAKGSERAESYRSAPLPRMSNIRIEVADPLPAPGSFEDYGAAEIRDLLSAAGVFRRHAAVSWLSGYTGGQVNTATGDFVFHCKAIRRITRDGDVLHRPAIFSGSMFGALGAIREAFGPLALDAIGTCGKWGQNVPSSGGSHFFLVLDPDPSFRLGGS